MECKSSCLSFSFAASFELIDTLWNVNTGGSVFLIKTDKELIDTLWNVNDCNGFPYCDTSVN